MSYDKIKENDKDRACGIYWGQKCLQRFGWESRKEESIEDPGLEENIILIYILKN